MFARSLLIGVSLISLTDIVYGIEDGYVGRRRVDCSRPKSPTEAAPFSPSDAQPESGTFQAPPPTGTVTGESNTMEIDFGKFRMPSLTIALPALQLPSLARVRRDPIMHTDSTTAPFTTRSLQKFDLNPVDGTRESGNINQKDDKETVDFDDDPSKPTAPVPPAICPPYDNLPRCTPYQCVPPFQGEGCVTLFGLPQEGAGDSQIARLEAQMAGLQKAVAQLAAIKAAELSSQSQPAVAAPPVRQVRPAAQQQQQIDPSAEALQPVRQISASSVAPSDAQIVRQQAAQIEALQRQLEALQTSGKPAESRAAAPAKQSTSAASVGRARLQDKEQPKRKSNPLTGFLGSIRGGGSQ